MKTNTYVVSFNKHIATIVKWIINHRLWVILCALMMLVPIVFIKLHIDNSIDVYFLEDDISYLEYREFMDEYGNDEFVYIVYQHEKGIFSLDALQKIKHLTEQIGKIPYIKDIKAITNLEFMEGGADGTLSVFSFSDEFPEAYEHAEHLKRKVLTKPYYVNGFLSQDGRYAAVLCELYEKPENDPTYHMKIGSALQKLLNDDAYQDFSFHVVGEPMINSVYNHLMMKEIPVLFLVCFMLIVLLLCYFFRHVKLVGGPLIVVSFSNFLCLMFIGHMGYPLTAIFGLYPPLMLAIGVATTVHFLTAYRNHLMLGNDNKTSIVESVKLVGFPCLFASITTAIGFGSLIISPVRIIHDYGCYSVFGVLVIVISAFTLLPVFLSFSGNAMEKHFQKKQTHIKKQGNREGFMDRMLLGISDFNKQYSIYIIIVCAILFLVALYGIMQLRVNSSWLERLGDKIDIVRDIKVVDRHMAGSGSFDVIIESNQPEGIKTKKMMTMLDQVQQFCEGQHDLVKKTFSIADIAKDINRSLHGNDDKFYRLPETDEETAQYLLLYEFSGGDVLESLVSDDMSGTRLTIFVKSTDSLTSKRFYDDLTNLINTVKPGDYTYKITGTSFLFLEGMRYVADTVKTSLLMAITITSIMMVIVFRSFRIGLISMIPNIFPIVLLLGFMGIMGIWLDAARALIGCIAIGIAVDDTIHFISRYRVEFDRYGNYHKALDTAMKEVGRAMTITTLVLMLGFMTGMLGKLNDNFYFGLLTSTCILLALLADYFLCPSLILMLKPFGKERMEAESHTPQAIKPYSQKREMNIQEV